MDDATETSALSETITAPPRSLWNMFWRDLAFQTPVGGWFLMLGLPLINVHGVGYIDAVLAHLCLGAAISAMRIGVRLESQLDDATERFRRQHKGARRGR